MKTNKKRRTNAEQRVAADILTSLYFLTSKDDFETLCKDIYERYELNKDPFTGLPCSDKDYFDNCLEYDRQVMMEKYGHCDGLD